ncbi:hypothetical protein AB0P21_26160 [Kribbella sp. NPDC056861]
MDDDAVLRSSAWEDRDAVRRSFGLSGWVDGCVVDSGAVLHA